MNNSIRQIHGDMCVFLIWPVLWENQFKESVLLRPLFIKIKAASGFFYFSSSFFCTGAPRLKNAHALCCASRLGPKDFAPLALNNYGPK